MTAIRRLLAFTGLLVLLASALVAQEVPGIDMPGWRALAERTETAVDDADTPNETLEDLRNDVADFRTQFNEARGVNATRIASLRDQLAQLGTPPAEGDAAPEAAEIARQRQQLEEQLATLTAPVQVADSAYARADALVGEIDTILRTRQAEQLLEVVETPLNPVHWPVAFGALRNAVSELWVGGDSKDTAAQQAELRRNLPQILFATLAGLILIGRGRRWSKTIVTYVGTAGARGVGVWRFVVSLLRIVFPLIGLTLLSYAARTSGYLGERGDQLVFLIPILGGLMLGFRWVSEQVFSRDEEDALITLSAKDRAEARFLVGGITLFIILNMLLLRIVSLDDASSLTKTVVTFPFTLLISYAVFRIGRLLRHYGQQAVAAEDDEVTRVSTLARLVRSLGTLTICVSVAAPLLQAAGYYNASAFVLHPTVLTLVILGLVLALQRFGADVYGAITGQGPAARDALVPIFIGMILLMLAMPVLALAWGARIADLTEIWAAFRRGFAIGESRISPTDFLTFALIFTFGYLATRLAQGALKTNVLPKTKIDKGGQNAIVSGLGYVGIFLAALAAITGAGIDLSSLAIVAGALSVGIGFGLQNIVSNFVSGIILLIERPISEGDWIEVSGGQMGYVRDISVRSTRIETFDRTDVIVPNADLVSGTVTNYTRGNTLGRAIVPVGVAYGTDTKKVEAILQEIASDQPMVLANPAPNVLFIGFGASSMDFEIRMFLRDVNWMMPVKSDVNHAIAKRFAEEGIEIPFAQQDIWFRNPEILRAASQTQGQDASTAEAPPTKQPKPEKDEPETPVAKRKTAQSAPLGDASRGEGDR
jgi:small-conductance mechanosensitive channel